MGAPPAASLKAKALRLLAQREHSRTELASKLQRSALQTAARAAARATARTAVQAQPAVAESEYDQDHAANTKAQLVASIETTLNQLQATGLQSDVRTAQVMVQAQSKRFGDLRLKRNLQSKGLPKELIEAAVAQSSQSEFERAHALWLRRFGQASDDRSEMARQARFLMARGFKAEVVAKVVRSIPGSGDEEEAEITDLSED